MRALVTGATGFVGSALLRRLTDPVILSRDPQRARQQLEPLPVTAYRWDPAEEPAPAEAFAGVDAVFHLAGESIAEGRWTAAKKERIRASRVEGTRNLVAGLRMVNPPPRLLVSASAVGYYGSRGDEELTEAERPGRDFLAEVCVAWEEAAREGQTLGIRVVNPRIGMVLGNGGGALAKLLPIFRSGLASPLGNGRQWMPWIHIDDLVQLLLFIAERDDLQGPLNATAPHPVSNREFTKTLAEVLHRPALLPAVPKFALRLSMGEFAEALLSTQRVLPAAALAAGFEFRHPRLRRALEDLLSDGGGGDGSESKG